MLSSEKGLSPHSPEKKEFAFKHVAIGAAALLTLLFVMGCVSPSTQNTQTTDDTSTLEPTIPETFDNPAVNLQLLKSTLSKEKFLKKLYEVDRSTYHLYDKAAQFLGTTNEEVTQFFFDCCDLINEADIFSEIPPIPSDFSVVAYDVSIGKLNQIGLLSDSFYKQPEFYSFIDQETGVVNREFAFRPWSRPELNQWGDNGFQAYPADQFDTVQLSKRNDFSAVVFVTNGWNIQNYVGVHLVEDNESSNYFDVTISEERTGQPYFLLGPTFPRFDKDWATKVVIEGKVKPGTPPGSYRIRIDPVAPASSLATKWAEEHPGLYASYGFIVPETGYINLQIDVAP